jgi:ribosomal protein S18 acetylase RimI-like enzyme
MATSSRSYVTKELSETTWPDFVKLFSLKSGWNHCWCVHFHRPRPLPKEKWLATRAERAQRNRREQKKLVDRGRSHGILVYLYGEPVGWCQYGPREELTRIDNIPNSKKVESANSNAKNQELKKLWRITCFVVDKKHSRQGIAGAALRAALQSIKKQAAASSKPIPWKIGQAVPSAICPRMERFPCSRKNASRSSRHSTRPT